MENMNMRSNYGIAATDSYLFFRAGMTERARLIAQCTYCKHKIYLYKLKQNELYKKYGGK
jgi:hypothetical protein